MNPTSGPTIDFLLLSGEGLSALTPARMETLEQLLSGLDLRLTVMQAAVKYQPRPEPAEPVPATRADFLTFAEEHGYTPARSYRAWNALLRTRYDTHRGRQDGDEPYPRLRFLDTDVDTVDLHSVHARLVASNLSTRAWSRNVSKDTVRFLAHVVNEMVKPEEPLPTGLGLVVD